LTIGRITTAKVMVMEHMLNATKKTKGHKFDSTKSSMPILALKSVAARQIFWCPPTSSREEVVSFDRRKSARSAEV
jgi:hypothetical protein